MPTWGRITVLGITNGDCPWGGSLRPVYILPKKERKNKLGLGLATAEDVSDVGQMGQSLHLTFLHCTREVRGSME